jgi:glycosyltransferase involved in cell wall biosynthesis
LGKVRDTAHVLEIADVFLLPSETESFGLAALEAMAVGVPVISSNSGGIPEVNIHGYSGYLSDVGDVNDMAENMLILLQEENLKTFKINAKERSKEFSLDSILPKYEKIYLNLIESKRY